MMAFKIITVES